MAGIGAIGGIVSGIGGGAGSMMSAQGEANALESQANAKAIEGQSRRRKGIEEQGVKSYEVNQQEKQRNKLASDQRAKFANSGGGVTGTARIEGLKLNEASLEKQGWTMWEGLQANKTRGYEADVLEWEAEQLRKAAKNKRTAGAISAGTSVVSGISGAFKGGSGIGGGGGPYYYSTKG